MPRTGSQSPDFGIAVQSYVLLTVHYPEITEEIPAIKPSKLNVSPVDNFKRVACLIFADTKVRHAYRLWHHKIFLSLETRQAGFLLKNQSSKNFFGVNFLALSLESQKMAIISFRNISLSSSVSSPPVKSDWV